MVDSYEEYPYNALIRGEDNGGMSIRLILKFIIFFPGTLLHELAHYLFALLLGKAEGFSLVPRRDGERFVFGSVKSRTRYKVFSSFIASAPLLWWAVLLMITLHFGVLRIGSGLPKLDLGLIMEKSETASARHLFFLWLCLELLWAGRLSREDILNVFRGFFSFSGLVFLVVTSVLFYILKKVSV